MPEVTKLRSKYELLPAEAWHYYKTHPVEFIENMILKPHSEKRGKTIYLSEQQKQVLQSIPHNGRITVCSGRGV